MTATAPSPLARQAPPTRWERVRGPVTLIGGLTAATVALHFRDPHQHGSWGLCPSAALGIYCPGCGGLRAVNDLTNGDVAAAASSNLLFVVALPFLVVGLALWAVARWRGTTIALPPRTVRPLAYAGLVLVVVFTLLRNLPAGTWLAP